MSILKCYGPTKRGLQVSLPVCRMHLARRVWVALQGTAPPLCRHIRVAALAVVLAAWVIPNVARMSLSAHQIHHLAIFANYYGRRQGTAAFVYALEVTVLSLRSFQKVDQLLDCEFHAILPTRTSLRTAL